MIHTAGRICFDRCSLDGRLALDLRTCFFFGGLSSSSLLVSCSTAAYEVEAGGIRNNKGKEQFTKNLKRTERWLNMPLYINNNILSKLLNHCICTVLLLMWILEMILWRKKYFHAYRHLVWFYYNKWFCIFILIKRVVLRAAPYQFFWGQCLWVDPHLHFIIVLFCIL